MVLVAAYFTIEPIVILLKAASNEVHFFDNDINFAKGYDWYKRQMPLGRHNVS